MQKTSLKHRETGKSSRSHKFTIISKKERGKQEREREKLRIYFSTIYKFYRSERDCIIARLFIASNHRRRKGGGERETGEGGGEGEKTKQKKDRKNSDLSYRVA